MPAINKNFIGNNIRRIRKSRNMTQTDLSELVGYNQRTVSNWEKGIHYPNPQTIRSIADALSIAPTEIIGHNDAPTDTSFEVIVDNNDMHPEIQVGDTIKVSTTAKYKDADLVYVELNNCKCIRRIYSHEGLISLLALDPQIGMGIYDESEINIVGKVVEIRRLL